MTDPLASLTDAELQFLIDNLDKFSEEEATELAVIAEEVQKRREAKACRDDLIEFCKKMQPDYKVGKHHRRLANLLMDIAYGRKDRICVNIAPRHGKSQLVSIYFPAWFLGHFPDKKILMVSHTTDLAVDFGRKVRNLIDLPAYKVIFPTVSLAQDNKSAGRWNTNRGGEYFACGVGSALAGRGADLLLVDDPHNEQDIINGNFDIFERAYEWFTYGARTRLMPGGRVAIVQCMPGDTPVLMADGSQRELKDVKVGDSVATYDDGKLAASTVLNWANQGPDSVYAVRLNNGNILRANERHPFLVERNGVLEWVRVKNLLMGDLVVSLKDAANRRDPQQNPVNANDVKLTIATTEDTPTRRTEGSDTMGSGKANNALKRAVRTLLKCTVCATHTHQKHTTINLKAPTSTTALLEGETATLNLSMGLTPRNTQECWRNKTTNAVFVNGGLVKWIYQKVGALRTHLPSTIAILQEEYGGYCATAATLSSKTGSAKKLSEGPFSTSKVVSIVSDGVEDVFDIEVERTHNFIANHSVVSNTRWHQDDLTGKMVRDMTQNEESDQYEVVEFPAMFNEGTPNEAALWPEFYDLAALRRTKASMPVFQWNAQYQQNPTSEEASIVKREWWKWWKGERPPSCEYIIMSLDAAAEAHNRADFTALTTWGVFLNQETDAYNIILLNSIKRRMEFPELKDMAMEEWKEWQPDAFIVEKKSAGTALYQELRRTGMAVQEYTPHRGSGDKLARLNSVADIIRSGLVWIPETRWAEEVVEEVAGFPFMSHDDLVDSTVMALMRFRNGGFIRLPNDEPDDPRFFRSKKKGYY